jgi:hypothetical protein
MRHARIVEYLERRATCPTCGAECVQASETTRDAVDGSITADRESDWRHLVPSPTCPDAADGWTERRLIETAGPWVAR